MAQRIGLNKALSILLTNIPMCVVLLLLGFFFWYATLSCSVSLLQSCITPAEFFTSDSKLEESELHMGCTLLGIEGRVADGGIIKHHNLKYNFPKKNIFRHTSGCRSQAVLSSLIIAKIRGLSPLSVFNNRLLKLNTSLISRLVRTIVLMRMF